MKNRSILLIEDDIDFRDTIKDGLTKSGYQVKAATSGEEAREYIRQQDFNIVILDIFLPGISGLSLLREIKATQPSAMPIAMSVHAFVDIAIEALKLGAVDFLIKPFSYEQLKRVIDQSTFINQGTIEVSEEYYAKSLQNFLPLVNYLKEECEKQPGYMGGRILVNPDNDSMTSLSSNWSSIECWKAWETSQLRSELYQFIYPKVVGNPSVHVYRVISS
jgi:DNA-binding response OmpR family regulator